MESSPIDNLGRALTALGLEDKFLSNGELTKYPLVTRARIADEIISEKLRVGKWQGVVDMIWGGFGKADALYEGDRQQLREEIVKSAATHGGEIEGKTLDTLKRAKEDELLFSLATSMPLSYDDFSSLAHHIDRKNYFEDPQKGPARSRAFEEMAADKALKEENVSYALSHLKDLKDSKRIGDLFNRVLKEDFPFNYSLLEDMALSDPVHREERLGKLRSQPLSEDMIEKRPLDVYNFVKSHRINVAPQQMALLEESVAQKAEHYQIGRDFKDNERIRLLWARNHAQTNPAVAYEILREQDSEGTQVIDAVIAGLAESHSMYPPSLSPNGISPEHLRRAYSSAPFEVQKTIAYQLKDRQALTALSEEANKLNKLRDAYSLWVAAGGDLEGKYIRDIREKLIKRSLDENYGYMHFLSREDAPGKVEAYEALMEQDGEQRENYVRHAYEIALELKDNARIKKAREELVEINPRGALFSLARGNKREGELRDKEGFDYVLSRVASQYGTNEKELRSVVEKYA